MNTEIQNLGFDLDTLYAQRYDATRAVAKAKRRHETITPLRKNLTHITAEILKMETHYDDLKAAPATHDKDILAAAGMNEQSFWEKFWAWCLGKRL
ncbi:MAG: hypothetical protein V3R25_05695 [Nitrosomonadaceae bacterium]